MHGQLLAVRSFELNRARSHFPLQSRVLEIGGGNGWQASNLSSWGLDVESIDVATAAESYHPVSLYDGIRLPYSDASFDLIFSSNVLEHLEGRPTLFAEMTRVLKPSGLMVHIVPTSSWRFWTSLAHYPYIVKRLGQLILNARSVHRAGQQTSTQIDADALPGSRRLKRLIWSGPHGVDKSAVKELFRYSRWGWRRCFTSAGFNIVDEYSTGLWYTGYGIAPRLSLGLRALISRVAGSSCRIFVLRPGHHSTP